jgi:hypothetical protein
MLTREIISLTIRPGHDNDSKNKRKESETLGR